MAGASQVAVRRRRITMYCVGRTVHSNLPLRPHHEAMKRRIRSRFCRCRKRARPRPRSLRDREKEQPRPSGEFGDGDFEDPDPVGARGDEFCVIEMVSPSLPNPAPTTSRRRRVFRAPTNPTASSTTHAH